MEPKSPSKLKSPITGLFKHKHFLFKTSPTVFVIFLLLFLGAYLLLALKPEKASKSSKERDSYYTVIVDCGSTGTRVDVYEWMIEKKNSKEKFPVLLHSYPDNSTESPLHQNSCQYHCLQTEPGLDKFVDNISGVRASLEPLILWAEQIVPIDKHKSTPIFVLATAGLRRLKIEDSKQVLNNVEDVVKEYSFMYKKSRIRVLSGEEEAYYGWVALNYKLGFLGIDSKKSTKLGLLDLGSLLCKLWWK